MKDLGPKLRYGERWGLFSSNTSSSVAAVTESYGTHKTVILRLHHVASSACLLIPQHSSLVLIATWAKTQCTSHSQLPLTYTKRHGCQLNWIIFQHFDTCLSSFSTFPQLLQAQNACSVLWEQPFVLATTDCWPLLWSHCCFACKWLNRQQLCRLWQTVTFLHSL